jgi:hypothetical protein
MQKEKEMNGTKKELPAACKATYEFLTSPGCYTHQHYWYMKEMLKKVIEEGKRKNIKCKEVETSTMETGGNSLTKK